VLGHGYCETRGTIGCYTGQRDRRADEGTAELPGGLLKAGPSG
jgi:hypothetical protein